MVATTEETEETAAMAATVALQVATGVPQVDSSMNRSPMRCTIRQRSTTLCCSITPCTRDTIHCPIEMGSGNLCRLAQSEAYSWRLPRSARNAGLRHTELGTKVALAATAWRGASALAMATQKEESLVAAPSVAVVMKVAATARAVAGGMHLEEIVGAVVLVAAPMRRLLLPKGHRLHH